MLENDNPGARRKLRQKSAVARRLRPSAALADYARLSNGFGRLHWLRGYDMTEEHNGARQPMNDGKHVGLVEAHDERAVILRSG